MIPDAGNKLEGRLAMIRKTPCDEKELATIVSVFSAGNGPAGSDCEFAKLKLYHPWQWETMKWKPMEFCYRPTLDIEILPLDTSAPNA